MKIPPNGLYVVLCRVRTRIAACMSSLRRGVGFWILSVRGGADEFFRGRGTGHTARPRRTRCDRCSFAKGVPVAYR